MTEVADRGADGFPQRLLALAERAWAGSRAILKEGGGGVEDIVGVVVLDDMRILAPLGLTLVLGVVLVVMLVGELMLLVMLLLLLVMLCLTWWRTLHHQVVI